MASETHQISDSFLVALLDDSRKSLRYLDLQNCSQVSDELFGSWISLSDGFNPDLEYVDFLIDRQLSKGPVPLLPGSSDSEATVLHRPSRKLRRPRGKSFVVGTTSGSEAEGFFYSRARLSAGGAGCTLTAQGLAMQRLTVLGLSGAVQLTDKGVLAVNRLLPWVQTLELRDCRSVAEDTIEDVRRNCRSLRKLFVSTPKLRVRFDTSRSFARRTRRHAGAVQVGSSNEDD